MVDSENTKLGDITVRKITDFSKLIKLTSLYDYLVGMFALKEHSHSEYATNQTLSNYYTKSEVDAFNSIFQVDYSVSSSENNNLASDASLKFTRQGNLVVCQYHISTVEFGNTVDHIVLANNTLHSLFTPSSDYYIDVVSYSGTIRHGLLHITSEGGVFIRAGTVNTRMNIYGSFTYTVGVDNIE